MSKKGNAKSKDAVAQIPATVDVVNAPSHYRQGEVECIEAIRSALGKDGFEAYCKGNVIKYVWRHNHKPGSEGQDLAKAKVYLNWAKEGKS